VPRGTLLRQATSGLHRGLAFRRPWRNGQAVRAKREV
jgi:hypothetical protein